MNIEEKDNTYKISMPLITDEEIRKIDNNFDSIVNEFTKQFIHEKELAIAQHIIKKQKAELEMKDKENKLLIALVNEYKNEADLQKALRKEAD